MADNTIDTLVIKIEGQDETGGSALDKLITKLERIKKAASGGSKISSVSDHLNSLKSKVNSIKTDKLEKLGTQAAQSAQRIEALTNRIREMETSFSDKPNYVMQKLIDKENELEAAASRIKDQLSSISNPPALNEKYTNQYNDIRAQIEQVSEKQLSLIENGKAFSTVAEESTKEYEKLNEQLAKEQDRFAEIKAKIEESTKEYEKLNEQLAKEQDRFAEIKAKIDESGKSASSFGSQVKAAFSDSIIGKFASKINVLGAIFGRMVLLRTMRTIIKQVTEGFKTGIDNMYQYSKAFNGDFARSMDQLASSSLTYKNSIGAIMAPIINMAVPWLDKVIDKLIEINNTAAMVIAGLTGKSTYSRAVRTTTEYAEAANKASANTEKVKDRVEELKRSLAGIDEITIIGENHNSAISSATGGNDNGNNGLDYGSMFVETPVDMAKVNEIKEKFDKILKVAKWIGLAIAAWKLATFISSIGQAISSLGTLSQKIVGISMMVVGFGIEFAGAYDMGRNGINLKNALLTALGAALGVAGSLLVFGTTPLGWAIGLGVALTVMVAGYVKGQWDKGAELAQMSEQYKEMTKIIEDSQAISERAQQSLQALADKKAALDTTLADFSAAQVLVEAIFDIYEKGDLSATEIAELQTKIEALNGLNLDGLQLEFDESSGTLYQIGVDADGTTEKIAATRDSVRELTESLKEQAITAALTDLLTESYKSLFEAQMQVEQADSNITKAQEALNDTTKEYQEYLRNTQYTDNPFSLFGMADKMGYYSDQIERAQEALDEAKTAQEDNDSVLKTSQGYIDAITNALISMKTGAADYSDPATKSSDILNSSLKDGDENVANLKSSLKAFSLDSVLSKYADGSSSSTKDLSEKIGSAKDQSLSLKDRLSNFKSNNTVASFADRATDSGKALSDSLINANNDALKLRRSLSQLDGFSGTFSYNYSFGRTPQYATGGFPEDGFFFANHNELVGQFSNGKTAVANNEQIVEGISEGVAAANREQNTLLREQNGLLRELLQKDSSIPVSTIVKAFNQKNRRDGKVTVPVAT